MDRSSVLEALSISPKIKYLAKWNKKKLIVKFTEQLESNTTYTMQLAGAYKDYYSNLAEEAFHLTFSTGSTIDSGSISGRIIGKTTNNISIFLYAIENNKADSTQIELIDYYKTEHDYKTILGSNGKFKIPR